MTALLLYASAKLMSAPLEFLASSSKSLEHRGPETAYSLIDQEGQVSSFIIIRSNEDWSVSQDDGLNILINATGPKKCILDTLNDDSLGALLLRIDSEGVSMQRSLDGSKPVYYHMDKGSLLIATEKKAIWAVGISDIKSLQPGHQLIFNGKSAEITRYISPSKISIRRNVSREGFIRTLSETLVHSFERLQDISECGVLFSGGVDSSLAALLTKQFCDETYLISVFAEDSHDSVASRNAAERLGVPIQKLVLNPDIVWDCLGDVIYAIETTNRMDVEIAIPFYLAGKVASQLGIKLVVSGQGPDELFAGYVRHVRIYEERGAEALEQQLMQDISITHEANLERDEKAIGYNGVSTIFPYLDQHFARIALSIPAEFKINPDETPNRKIIFRELAMKLGLDPVLAMRPKRATQYSSGTRKVLLNAISDNIEEYQNCSRKRLETVVQKVLDKIGSDVGVF